MKKVRAGNDPKRRLAPENHLTPDQVIYLKEHVVYTGSGHHKRNPGDYGLERANPRPFKSLCDGIDVMEKLKLSDAKSLLQSGIDCGMFSPIQSNGFPKYIWGVTNNGEVYESKTDINTPGIYHGYPLGVNDDVMKVYIKKVWAERCQKTG